MLCASITVRIFAVFYKSVKTVFFLSAVVLFTAWLGDANCFAVFVVDSTFIDRSALLNFDIVVCCCFLFLLCLIGEYRLINRPILQSTVVRQTVRHWYRSIYRPTLHRHSTDIATDTSTDSRPRNRPIYLSIPPIRHMIRFFLAALKIRCIQYYSDTINLLTWKLTSLVILSSDSKLSNGEIKPIRRSLPGGTSGQCMRSTFL